jgi:hypothetical protein
MLKLDFAALSALAAASAAASADKACGCNAAALAGWESLPASLDLAQFHAVGTLVDDPYAEPTFAEFHPAGTRYDSPAAPIAPRYFPYNRCEVARCLACGRCFLRYTEAGGYFTDPRIRVLRPELLVDAPL